MKSYVVLFIAALTVQLFCESLAASIRIPDVEAELSEEKQTEVALPAEEAQGGEADPSSEDEEEPQIEPIESESEDTQDLERPVRSVDIPSLELINEDISDALSKETEGPITVIFPEKVSEEEEESPEDEV